MKTIDQIPEDIETLFKEGKKIDEINLDLMLKNMRELILKRFEQKPKELNEKKTIRMSKIGTPNRKLWYEFNVPLEEETNFNSLKFLYGDLIEQIVLFLIKEAGHTVEHEQAELEIDGVLGHKDATIDGFTTDIKSTSSFAFRKFYNGSLYKDDPFGYIAQLSAYAKADKNDKAAFLAINKENGQIAVLKLQEIDMIDPKKRIAEVREVVTLAAPPTEKCYEPEPDGKAGNMMLNKNCGYCVTPETLVLKEDLTWVSAGELKVQDRIIGFTEDPLKEERRRYYRFGSVTSVPRFTLPCIRVSTDTGTIEVSEDHKFLVKRKNKSGIVWKEAKNLKLTDKIRTMPIWKFDDSNKAGWLSGIFDGEGCYSSGRVSVSQNPGLVLSKIESLLALKNFSIKKKHVKNNNRCMSLSITNGLDQVFRLLGELRPIRLLFNFSKSLEEHAITVKKEGYSSIKEIKPVGEKEVIGLETTCSTYIANGFFSHNCSFKDLCWKSANDGKGIRRFQYANGIRELVEVSSEPKVEEVFNLEKST